jgi:hypothetical protein
MKSTERRVKVTRRWSSRALMLKSAKVFEKESEQKKYECLARRMCVPVTDPTPFFFCKVFSVYSQLKERFGANKI